MLNLRQPTSSFLSIGPWIVAGLFASGLAPDARAVGPEGNEFQLNATTAGRQEAPDVAIEADGDLVAIWSAAAPPGQGRFDDIVVRRFDSAGFPTGGETILTDTFSSAFPSHRNPAIGVSAAGAYAAAWSVGDQDDGQWVARSDGTNPPSLTLDQSDVDLARNRFGTTRRVWAEITLDGESSEIRTDGAVTLSSPTCSGASCRSGSPSVALAPSGSYGAAWLEQGDLFEEEPYVAVIARVPGGLVRVTPDHSVFSVSVRPPRPAISDNGTVLVTWTERSLGALDPSQVKGRIYSSSGAVLTPEFVVGHGGGQAAVSTGDGFVVAWLQGQNVVSRSFDLAGVETTPPTVISASPFDKSDLALAAFDDRLVAVWASEDQDGDGEGIFGTLEVLPPTPVAPSPILHLSLNEGIGRFAFDRSGLGDPAPLGADGSWVPALVDEGLEMTESTVVDLSRDLVAGTGRGTYSVWLRAPEAPAALGWVMGERLSGGNKSWALAVHNIYGHPGVLCQKNVTTGGGPFWINAPVGETVVGSWTHVAVAFDEGQTRLYVNGSPVASGDECGSFGAGLERFTLGALGQADGFVGILDEPKVFDLALTDAEVATLYADSLAEASTVDTLPPMQLTAGVTRIDAGSASVSVATDEAATLHVELGPGPELGGVDDWSSASSPGHSRTVSGLVPDLSYAFAVTSVDAAGNASRQTLSLVGTAEPTETVYLPFDEGAGTATLETVSGATLTVTGSPAWSAGPVASALEFATGERVEVPGAFVAATGYGAYSLWVRHDAVIPSHQFLVSESVGGANAGWALYLQEQTGRLTAAFQSADGVGYSPFQIYGPVVPPGQWTHVAVSFEPRETSLFVDGVKVASGPTGRGFQPPQNLLVIGGAPHAPLYQLRLRGAIDDLRVFDLPLSESAVAALAAAGSP